MQKLLIDLSVRLASLAPQTLGRITNLLSLLLVGGLGVVLVLFVKPFLLALGLMVAFTLVFAIRNVVNGFLMMKVAQMQSAATLTALLDKIAANAEKTLNLSQSDEETSGGTGE